MTRKPSKDTAGAASATVPIDNEQPVDPVREAPEKSAASAPDDASEPEDREPRGAHFAPAVSEDNIVPPEELLTRKKIKVHTRRKKAVRVLAIVLAIVLLAGAGIAVAVRTSIDAGQKAFEESTEKAKEEQKKNQITYNGHAYELNDHMATICFIGFDYQHYDSRGNERTRQSDAVVVMALNTDTGKATAIVIPRDSMVDVDVYSNGTYVGQEQQQIALQFAYGDGADGSAGLVAEAASRVLYDIPIDYYFALDINGVGPINDSIGGVTLEPLMTIPNTSVVQGQTTTLFGKNAERYVQYRDSQGIVSDSTTSALDRQARQVQYMKAFINQVLSSAKTNPTSLVSLYQTALQYTYTNLGVNEFSYLASTMLDKGIASFEFTSLPGEQVQNDTLAEYHLDREGIRDVVMQTFYHRVD